MERGTYKGDPLQKHFSKKALQDLYEIWKIIGIFCYISNFNFVFSVYDQI